MSNHGHNVHTCLTWFHRPTDPLVTLICADMLICTTTTPLAQRRNVPPLFRLTTTHDAAQSAAAL